jgi:hypothetical protein
MRWAYRLNPDGTTQATTPDGKIIKSHSPPHDGNQTPDRLTSDVNLAPGGIPDLRRHLPPPIRSAGPSAKGVDVTAGPSGGRRCDSDALGAAGGAATLATSGHRRVTWSRGARACRCRGAPQTNLPGAAARRRPVARVRAVLEQYPSVSAAEVATTSELSAGAAGRIKKKSSGCWWITGEPQHQRTGSNKNPSRSAGAVLSRRRLANTGAPRSQRGSRAVRLPAALMRGTQPPRTRDAALHSDRHARVR